MQFCPICPVPLMHKFCDLSDTQMALAQYVRDDAAYRNYYIEARKRGDVVILDNGAYEKTPVTFHELVEIIREVQPTYYIIPDEVNTFLSNQISLDWLTFLKRDHYDLLTVARIWAVQADPGNLNQYINSYLMGVSNAQGISLVKRSEFGFPDEDPFMRRVQFIEHLKAKGIWQPDVYVHILGLINGHIDELNSLHQLGCNSIDSSAPIFRGLMGYALQQEWPEFPFELYPQITSTARMESGPTGEVLADKNLRKVFNLCQHKIPARQSLYV